MLQDINTMGQRRKIIKTYLTIGVFDSSPQDLLMSIGTLIRNGHPVQPTGEAAQTGLDILVVLVLMASAISSFWSK